MYAKAEISAGPGTAPGSLQGEPLGKASISRLSSLVICYAATVAVVALEKDQSV